MQIHIDTATDDLPAVIRMLQAYGGHQATAALVADVKELSAKVESAARSMGIVKSDPDHKIESSGLVPHPMGVLKLVADVNRELQAIDPKGENLGTTPIPPCSAHADEPDEEPTPEEVFAAPPIIENYVYGGGGGAAGGAGIPSLFDAPLSTTVQGEVSSASTRLSDVTVDAAGLPWDARIHSGAKSKLANGNWKLLRGVDPARVASVEAELRGAPKPVASASAPSSAPVPPAPPVAPPTTAAAVAPAVSPPAPKPITNAAELVAAVMDKRFTTDQVNAACQKVGVENVASLLAKQDMLPLVLRELGV